MQPQADWRLNQGHPTLPSIAIGNRVTLRPESLFNVDVLARVTDVDGPAVLAKIFGMIDRDTGQQVADMSKFPSLIGQSKAFGRAFVFAVDKQAN